MISAIGQADDVMLAATSLYHLQLLVKLTEQYCATFMVKIEPSKTKLLAYYNKESVIPCGPCYGQPTVHHQQHSCEASQ